MHDASQSDSDRGMQSDNQQCMQRPSLQPEPSNQAPYKQDIEFAQFSQQRLLVTQLFLRCQNYLGKALLA